MDMGNLGMIRRFPTDLANQDKRGELGRLGMVGWADLGSRTGEVTNASVDLVSDGIGWVYGPHDPPMGHDLSAVFRVCVTIFGATGRRHLQKTIGARARSREGSTKQSSRHLPRSLQLPPHQLMIPAATVGSTSCKYSLRLNLSASHNISTALLAAQLLLIFFVPNSPLCHATTLTSASKNGREALEIIIGDFPPIAPAYPPSNGDDPLCPPPPPPPEPLCPSPTPPPSPPIVYSPPKQNPPPPPKVHSPPKPKPSPPAPSPIPYYLLASELSVIQRFKKTITSDPFGKTKTWVGKNICKDYEAFICDKNRIVGINFNGFNFDGKNLSFKNFIEKIKTLVIIHFNSNNFTVCFLPVVQSKIEPTTAQYIACKRGFNRQVFTLDLDVLFLNNNGFSGTIPENLGRTAALFLTLANNKFTGGIPKSIGNARETHFEVLFLNNQLFGCLPYEIGLLKLATVFDASKNKLTGPIPQSFGR
ncbi:hypothetical protein RND71_019597 [Anisodus tanguticus]|uniref:Uncharacterized protein n=1 Tax=Anisodus tanguticus TaxID=243964 RepID=A0AAE1RZL8_9SOLA|nr:hypothetical protein RND71_019597 [Anisodus tanguticus]